jgi:hypothetical protein
MMAKDAAKQLLLLLSASVYGAHLACCAEHHRVCDDLVSDRIFELILLITAAHSCSYGLSL